MPLVLQRALNESIIIGEDIEVTVTLIDTNRIRLMIEAPGFYPVTADIPEKRHTVPKECSCPDAENIAQSSNAKPLL